MTDADQLVCLQIMFIGPKWKIFEVDSEVDHVMLELVMRHLSIALPHIHLGRLHHSHHSLVDIWGKLNHSLLIVFRYGCCVFLPSYNNYFKNDPNVLMSYYKSMLKQLDVSKISPHPIIAIIIAIICTRIFCFCLQRDHCYWAYIYIYIYTGRNHWRMHVMSPTTQS